MMGGMDDLVQFLRARLDDDKATALAAVHVNGQAWRISDSHADDGGEYWSIVSPTNDHATVVELVGSGMSGGGAHTAEVAEHIARHDPARVLADVQAKREMARVALATRDYHETFVNGVAAAMEQVLRLFAVAYAGHPDYREEWRP